MKNNTYKWTSFDNQELFGQSWIPDSEPKAIVNFVHGIGEHTDRYQDWMSFFVKAGFAVFAIEYRGHGRSYGKRGYIKNYDELLNDIDVLLEESKKAFPNLPQFLYGHSLGGGLVTNYTLTRKPNIKALVATSPWFLLTKEPPSWQVSLVKFLRNYIPGLTIPTGLNTNDITHNSDVIKAYKTDKMIHGKINIELFISASENGVWDIEHAKEMPVPFLLVHGSDDKITSPKGSEAFYNNNKEKTTLKIWEGMFHELHNETIREEHALYIINFLKQNL
jgi:alpha-beta hydrolase superfamily lysophospholipase